MREAAKGAWVVALWVGVIAPTSAAGATTRWDVGTVVAPAAVEALPAFTPAPVEAAGDCRVRCGLVLGVTSFTVAVGSTVTWSRINGGIRTRSQGQAILTISFGASLATAATLSGSRRERAVYSAGVGTAAGALLGFTLSSLAGGDEGSTKVAAALVGATLGALAGGVYGAFSHEEDEGAGAALAAQRIPLVAVRIPF